MVSVLRARGYRGQSAFVSGVWLWTPLAPPPLRAGVPPWIAPLVSGFPLWYVNGDGWEELWCIRNRSAAPTTTDHLDRVGTMYHIHLAYEDYREELF